MEETEARYFENLVEDLIRFNQAYFMLFNVNDVVKTINKTRASNFLGYLQHLLSDQIMLYASRLFDETKDVYSIPKCIRAMSDWKVVDERSCLNLFQKFFPEARPCELESKRLTDGTLKRLGKYFANLRRSEDFIRVKRYRDNHIAHRGLNARKTLNPTFAAAKALTVQADQFLEWLSLSFRGSSWRPTASSLSDPERIAQTVGHSFDVLLEEAFLRAPKEMHEFTRIEGQVLKRRDRIAAQLKIARRAE